MKYFVFILLSSFSLQPIFCQQKTNPQNQDEELGKVAWYRDYDTALQLATKESKPVLILFQEVPGCATCRNYGHKVLSNPLMTEAIENEFIPLAIFNNKRGKDKEILNKYNEPAWNNPVVRIVNANGDNIVQRVASDYSARGLYNAMVSALKETGNPIPEYMKILGKELSAAPSKTKETYYSMYCFWTGEKQLGSQEGVLNTEAGFMKGREVVKVTYNPEVIGNKTLTNFALQHQMKPIAEDNSYYHSKKDEDYYLQHSNFKYLPLSKLQRTKINSALGSRKNPYIYLSPSQKIWLDNIGSTRKKGGILYNKEFTASWNKLATE